MEPSSTRRRAVRIGARVVLVLAALAIFAGSASALPVRYFVVAEDDPCFVCDSYILPLSDLDDIASAHSIIARGGTGLGTIVVAKIVAGSDGINRNVLAPGEPLWSWHVTEFVAFAEGVGEILEGTPTGVESDVEGWIRNTSFGRDYGLIGFTTYTVVAELPVPEPGSLALLAAGCGLLACLRRRAYALEREVGVLR